MIHELCPVVLCFPFGTLVGYEPYDFGCSSFAAGDDMLCCFLHGDTFASKLLSECHEEVVHHRVLERMIYLSPTEFGPEVKAEGGYPFPVAVMSQVYEGKLLVALDHFRLQLVQPFKGYPAHDFFFAHVQELQCLYDIVTEEMVEFPFCLSDPFRGMLWKRVFQLSAYQFASVSCHVINQRE